MKNERKKMTICNKCRHKRGKYCGFYSTNLLSINAMITCTGYKEKPKVKRTNDNKRKSVKQEKRLAKVLGAKRTPQSGAQDTAPTDMIVGNYIIESKATKGKSLSVKEEWLSSLKASPMHMGKIPTLILEFPEQRRYVVIAEEDFNNIIKENK